MFENIPLLHNASLIKEHDKLQGTFHCPSNLTIVTCKNKFEKTPFEINCDRLSIEYTSIFKLYKEWHNTNKLKMMRQYISERRCKTKYLLFCDALDAIFINDPKLVLDVFEVADCDLLFSSTSFLGGYGCMPDKKRWVDSITDSGRYLNSGVYIGRIDFMLEVLEKAIELISPNPMTRECFRAMGCSIEDDRLCKELPWFPYGVSSDQVILRYLEPSFYPRLKVDYESKLAYRY